MAYGYGYPNGGGYGSIPNGGQNGFGVGNGNGNGSGSGKGLNPAAQGFNYAGPSRRPNYQANGGSFNSNSNSNTVSNSNINNSQANIQPSVNSNSEYNNANSSDIPVFASIARYPNIIDPLIHNHVNGNGNANTNEGNSSKVNGPVNGSGGEGLKWVQPVMVDGEKLKGLGGRRTSEEDLSLQVNGDVGDGLGLSQMVEVPPAGPPPNEIKPNGVQELAEETNKIEVIEEKNVDRAVSKPEIKEEEVNSEKAEEPIAIITQPELSPAQTQTTPKPSFENQSSELPGDTNQNPEWTFIGSPISSTSPTPSTSHTPSFSQVLDSAGAGATSQNITSKPPTSSSKSAKTGPSKAPGNGKLRFRAGRPELGEKGNWYLLSLQGGLGEGIEYELHDDGTLAGNVGEQGSKGTLKGEGRGRLTKGSEKRSIYKTGDLGKKSGVVFGSLTADEVEELSKLHQVKVVQTPIPKEKISNQQPPTPISQPAKSTPQTQIETAPDPITTQATSTSSPTPTPAVTKPIPPKPTSWAALLRSEPRQFSRSASTPISNAATTSSTPRVPLSPSKSAISIPPPSESGLGDNDKPDQISVNGASEGIKEGDEEDEAGPSTPKQRSQPLPSSAPTGQVKQRPAFNYAAAAAAGKGLSPVDELSKILSEGIVAKSAVGGGKGKGKDVGGVFGGVVPRGLINVGNMCFCNTVSDSLTDLVTTSPPHFSLHLLLSISIQSHSRETDRGRDHSRKKDERRVRSLQNMVNKAGR